MDKKKKKASAPKPKPKLKPTGKKGEEKKEEKEAESEWWGSSKARLMVIDWIQRKKFFGGDSSGWRNIFLPR